MITREGGSTIACRSPTHNPRGHSRADSQLPQHPTSAREWAGDGQAFPPQLRLMACPWGPTASGNDGWTFYALNSNAFKHSGPSDPYAQDSKPSETQETYIQPKKNNPRTFKTPLNPQKTFRKQLTNQTPRRHPPKTKRGALRMVPPVTGGGTGAWGPPTRGNPPHSPREPLDNH